MKQKFVSILSDNQCEDIQDKMKLHTLSLIIILVFSLKIKLECQLCVESRFSCGNPRN